MIDEHCDTKAVETTVVDGADTRLALEEMRLNMQQSLDAGDALDQKVNLLLAASGLILALATTLEISLSVCHSALYWAVLSATVGSYVVGVGSALWAVGPQPYRMAIASSWDALQQCILDQPQDRAVRTLLAGYVTQIQNNRMINKRKAIAQRISLVTLAVTVVFLVVLAAISLT